MTGLRSFLRRSFIGGILVVAPAVILLAVFNWLFDAIIGAIQPLSGPVESRTDLPAFLVDGVVLLGIVFICFAIGTIVSTRIGASLQRLIEERLARFAPGYRLVKDVLNQFLSTSDDSPFGSGEVALVKPYGPDTPVLCTAVVTSRHDSGWFSVFVPTGPNPTSGFVYHLPPDCVELRPEVKLDTAFRTVLSCGAGSAAAFTIPMTDDKAA